MAQIVPGSPQWHDDPERLLDLLEEEVSLFSEGRDPDYDTIQSVVHFFLNHIEVARYDQKHSAAQSSLDTTRENAGTAGGSAPRSDESVEFARQFAVVIQEVLAGAELPRDDLVRIAMEFIKVQRHQLRTTIPFRIARDPRILRALGISI